MSDKKATSTANIFLKKLKYKLSRNGEYYIVTGMKLGCPKEIKIPLNFKNKPVCGIGRRAFADKGVTSVQLSSSIRFISDKAFANCRKMTEFKSSQNLVTVGKKAFYGCSRLTSVFLPKSAVIIRKNAFTGCKKLTISCERTSPPPFLKRGWNCRRPVTYYREEAKPVYDLDKLSNTATNTAVKEPEVKAPTAQIVSKDANTLAFEYRRSAGAYIVTGIGSFTEEVLDIPDKYDGKPVSGITAKAFMGCASIKELTIPASIVAVGPNAFDSCPNLVSVTIKTGLNSQSLGKEAFRECASLTNVNMGASVSDIPYDAFLNCPSLKEITVDSNNPVYCSVAGVLYTKDKKTLLCCPANAASRITVPNYVATIGKYAFSYSTVLERLVIQEGVVAIEDGAFSACKRLKFIQLPETLMSIGVTAFQSCLALTEITIPAGVETIGANAFFHCKSIEIKCKAPEQPAGWDVSWNLDKRPVHWNSADASSERTTEKVAENVTTVEEEKSQLAFTLYSKTDTYIVTGVGSCTDSHISIPETHEGKRVSAIGSRAFANCTKLYRVDIPESVVIIAQDAFAGCTSLEVVRISEGVCAIGDGAFANCTSLTRINIPASVSEISYSAFEGCSSIEKYEVNPRNAKFLDDEGILYSKDFSTLIKYPIASRMSDFAIPSLVSAIAPMAFYEAQGLEAVFIHDEVKSVGEKAFGNSPRLSIVCYLAGKPEGWDDGWNPQGYPVDWKMAVNTEEPVVEEPIVEAPIIEEPIVEEPIVEEPIVEEPIIEEPIIEEPIVEEPIVEEPIIEEPIVEEPIVEEPIVEEPIIEEPIVEEPIIEEPIVEAPIIEEPIVEEPIVEEPIIEEPIVEAPIIEEPIVEEPSAQLELALNKNGNAYAVKGCGTYNKGYVEIPSEYDGIPVTSVGKWSFKNSEIEGVAIPETVTFIGDKAFIDCTSLKSVEFKDGIKYVNAGAFSGCTALTSIYMPDSLKQIGLWAFKGCTSLTAVSLPATAEVDEKSFEDCPARITYRQDDATLEEPQVEDVATDEPVTDITIDEPVTDIVIDDPIIDELTTEDDSLINEFTIDDILAEDILIKKIMDDLDAVKELIDPTEDDEEKPVTPAPVNGSAYSQGLVYSLNKNGDSYAVKGIGTCTDGFVTIPCEYEGLPVTSVGKWAFKGASISGVSIPSSVTFIGDKAFMDCQNLSCVSLSQGVKYLNAGAFCNCTSLSSISFPSTLKQIGFWAFKGCSSLTGYHVPSSVSVDPSAFEGCGL